MAVEGPVTEVAVEGPDVVDTSSPIGMDMSSVVTIAQYQSQMSVT